VSELMIEITYEFGRAWKAPDQELQRALSDVAARIESIADNRCLTSGTPHTPEAQRHFCAIARREIQTVMLENGVWP
jgi:phage gp36-like protein